jgi:hypothetical protein
MAREGFLCKLGPAVTTSDAPPEPSPAKEAPQPAEEPSTDPVAGANDAPRSADSNPKTLESEADAPDPAEPVSAAPSAPPVTVVEPSGSPSGSPGERKEPPRAPGALRYAFLLVPLVALTEIALYAKQSRDVVPAGDWAAAKAHVASKLAPTDLVVFAPNWQDAVGRQVFGPEIMTMERAARPDNTRFRRTFEVSARGAHRPEFADWKLTEQVPFGALRVSLYENPAPVTVIDDLIKRISPDKAQVYRLESAGTEAPCAFVRGPVGSGGTYYPFGPATPGDRFNCGSSYVGVSVVQALDHEPRLCIFAPPIGGGQVLQMRFPGVRFGKTLHGHHGIHYDAERHKTGTPVMISFRVKDTVIGRTAHVDGQGWSGFDFETTELDGKSDELRVEVTSASGANRKYCFEADTR